MDGMTAGIALAVAKFCIAAIMIGVYYVMPERSLRYWAIASVLSAIASLILTANAGVLRPLVIVAASGTASFAMILQWMGLRAFYRKPVGYAGWAIGAISVGLVILLVVTEAPTQQRALVFTGTVLAMLLLCAFELQTGQRGRHTFASRLMLGTVLFLAMCFSLSVMMTGLKLAEFSPSTSSPAVVSLIFLAPIAGSMMIGAGQLLLVFERLIADKSYLATHDELTTILNRRAIVAGGEREVAIARRTGQPLTVAFVDIDFFKQVNDRYGHEVGDRVLTEVADVIMKTCRGTDLVGRYGGEEFCIVLPGVAREGAGIFGERLLRAIRQHRFRTVNAVTISIGLASGDCGREDCTWGSLISRADEQLYRAKEAGRDRFHLSAEIAPLAAQPAPAV